MKKTALIVTALLMASAFSVSAQTNSSFVKGTLDIRYNSRETTPPKKGVKDVYTIEVNVANSALFRGTVTDQPQIIEGMFSKGITQPRLLTYDVQCDVVNPKNPAQTKNVGKMSGNVPISSEGFYLYDKGTLSVDILPIGRAAGFSSKFSGITVGKPMGRPANFLETLQRQTVNITRTVGGKTTVVALKKYDKMEFRNHIIGAGPIAKYQAVTVNGDMLYDYDKDCWFFNNVTIQYVEDNNVKIDRVSGTIRWDEKVSAYEFDIRVNEPVAGAAAAFESSGDDESAFFETDTTIPALTGKMTYKDTVRGDTTLASKVDIDLVGNLLTPEQLMSLAKVIVFSSIVPMNSD